MKKRWRDVEERDEERLEGLSSSPPSPPPKPCLATRCMPHHQQQQRGNDKLLCQVHLPICLYEILFASVGFLFLSLLMRSFFLSAYFFNDTFSLHTFFFSVSYIFLFLTFIHMPSYFLSSHLAPTYSLLKRTYHLQGHKPLAFASSPADTVINYFTPSCGGRGGCSRLPPSVSGVGASPSPGHFHLATLDVSLSHFVTAILDIQTDATREGITGCC